MISRVLRMLGLVSCLAIASPIHAGEVRHEFLEPIHPARPQQRADDVPPVGQKLCYCRTIHERNAAGRLTWRIACTESQPDQGARKIFAPNCGSIHNLQP